jgi:hypothetical protein
MTSLNPAQKEKVKQALDTIKTAEDSEKGVTAALFALGILVTVATPFIIHALRHGPGEG